ncbi:virulence factor Mce-like protein [Rhodococcus sp. AG1013]|uniref:MCE family protein n=1 Tax=Rhodococcus sp. AG1013 TaxID=2183996 RepID=UPI000E0BC843|nr:MCE family protein [Rhodococcus sp. AG1013]RDI28157.1 virulence factor Mce-like protein [Rhodococcus sp. AG1013]
MDVYSRRRTAFLVRGAIAVLVAVVAGTAMVLRGTGQLHRDPEVVVAIPASAGLVSGEAPVRYSGVNVGRISGIEPGTESSVVRLQLDADAIGLIPATVTARVVPRTFFGDIYIQLVDDPGPPALSETSLSDGDEVRVDSGPEAVALYGVYTRLVDVLDRMQPQKMQVALSALSQALDGRGETVGRIIGQLDAASRTLAPAAETFLDATPEFRAVLQALDTATPDVVATLSSAASVSRSLVDNADSLSESLSAAASFAPVLAGFLGGQRDRIVTVVDSTGVILATTAADPTGLVDTLEGARTFGAAGARVFSTGHFDITAVPTFADPMPYTAADCPSYGALAGACGPVGVDGGADEQQALQVLQDRLLGATADSEPAQSPVSTLMLGPLVRGTEVQIR